MLAIIQQQQQQRQQRKEEEEGVPSYNPIRLACSKRGITSDMRFCRKIHATHLHQSSIPVEIIDALQGRTPASVFAKHYYRPSLDYREKVLTALEKTWAEDTVVPANAIYDGP
jgi:intergrase/recombinase